MSDLTADYVRLFNFIVIFRLISFMYNKEDKSVKPKITFIVIF